MRLRGEAVARVAATPSRRGWRRRLVARPGGPTEWCASLFARRGRRAHFLRRCVAATRDGNCIVPLWRRPIESIAGSCAAVPRRIGWRTGSLEIVLVIFPLTAKIPNIQRIIILV